MKIANKSILALALLSFAAASFYSSATAQSAKLKALIIDGENNHGAWPMTTVMMKDYLEKTGRFEVEVARKAFTWQGPHNNASIGEERIANLLNEFPISGLPATTAVDEPVEDPNFLPIFSNYDVVVSNLGWKASAWPEITKKRLENFVRNGGGFVVVHAANNSFGEWKAYNEMIGLGGWGGRTAKDGPYVFYNEEGQLIRDPGEGDCGSHGPQQEFVVTIRDPDHPITRGLPREWMHAKDELYDRLRGPAKGMTVLATAYSDVEKNAPPWNANVVGSGRHEPMLLTTDFGEGRVFHTVMGHTDYSIECVGFMVTFQRGVEWAATGTVLDPTIPDDFPSAQVASRRKWMPNR